MDRAIKLGSLEGMFQGLRFYRVISALSVQKSYIHILSSNIDKIESLGYQGMVTGQGPVVSSAFTAYSEIIDAIFNYQPRNFDHYFYMLDRHLSRLVLYGYNYTAAGDLKSNLVAQQDVSSPHNKIMELVFRAQAKANESTQADEKRDWQAVTLDLVEELRKSVRILSDDMKNPNHMLILTFGEIIGKIGVLLIKLAADQEWENQNASLIVEAKSYLHLSTWFLNEIDNFESNQSFDSLIEAITNIGMASLNHNNMNDIASDAVKILSSKAIEFIEKKKSRGGMYLESDVMEHACYLGIIANKKGYSAIVTTLKEKIREFEAKYLQKYYSGVPAGFTPYTVSPPADKLRRDVEALGQRRGYGWTDRFGMGIVDDSADRLMSSVEAVDIQDFVSAIWDSV